MYKTIESMATPDGRVSCELLSNFSIGTTVYSVHVYNANDDYEYQETYRSYPTGSMRKARSLFKQYCNHYLRNRNHR